MKVLKFGGTSVQFHNNMRQVKEILASMQDEQILLVLSACRGATDNLLKLAEASARDNQEVAQELISSLSSHHLTLLNDLKLSEELHQAAKAEVQNLLDEISTLSEGISLLKELTPRSNATMAAFGELLSTTIFSYYLKSEGMNVAFFDARKIMSLYYNKQETVVDFEKTKINLRNEYSSNLYNGNNLQVIQGFIGSDSLGNTAVLSRGGSDYSAAVFAAALDVSEIQIWTDVSGIFSSDPRFFPDAISIESMTFAEVRELSAFGAKVLHPDTVKPAIDANIPVRVLNTNEPKAKGTTLRTTCADKIELDAMAMQKQLFIFNIVLPSDKNKNAEILQKIAECMLASSAKYYLISQGISKISILTDNISRLSAIFSRNYHCEIKDNIAAICLVGKNLRNCSNNHLLQNIAETAGRYKLESFEIISDEAIYIVLSELDNVDELYAELHSLVI